MLDALVRDGFIRPCPGAQPNCRLFVIPKSLQKVSLIADLRFLNEVSKPYLGTFRLPTIRDVVGFISRFPPGQLWGVKFDLWNFYWSLRVPDGFGDLFRVYGGVFDSLPCGWNMSPLSAQETLRRFVGEYVGPGEPLVGQEGGLGVWLNLDDILILAPDKELCGLVAMGII